MRTWRVLDLEYPDAPSNLALEEAIARHVGSGDSPPTLRLWRNRRAAVIGENQRVGQEVHLDACRQLGVEVVRRFTGGGAVYHDLGNLNYSICAPKSPTSNLDFHQAVFKPALECVVASLRTLGLEGWPAPVNAVLIRGRKVSGGAGAIRWRAIFYHGSILVSTDLDLLWRILRQEQPPATGKFVQSKRLPVTSIERELGREVPLEQVKEAVKHAFMQTFNACLASEGATDQELHEVPALVEEKYGSDKWNLRV